MPIRLSQPVVTRSYNRIHLELKKNVKLDYDTEQDCCEVHGVAVLFSNFAEEEHIAKVRMWLNGKYNLEVNRIDLVEADVEDNTLYGQVYIHDFEDKKSRPERDFLEFARCQGEDLNFTGFEIDTEFGRMYIIAYNIQNGYYSHDVNIQFHDKNYSISI